MGLDMFLRGEIYFWGVGGKRKKKEGFDKVSETYDLGYWRKHPNLHGYIVENFAGGEDNCRPIELSTTDVDKIICAIKAKELPETEGFFFGKSMGDEAEDDIEIFNNALRWVEKQKKGESRSIVYKASW